MIVVDNNYYTYKLGPEEKLPNGKFSLKFMGGVGPHTNPREKTREKNIRTKISGKTHIT